MGTNGVQEPAVGFEGGKLVGTPRLYTDGKFGTEDGKAHFMAAPWRGLQAKGHPQFHRPGVFYVRAQVILPVPHQLLFQDVLL